MPMIRYQIRNEYGLADPELYGAAEKDDPDALLEGVATAGLVGVLRQLGDLAEFAAEIFRNLHEEVIGTAARGHGLMLRVQQLEAEFPSIEKAFFTQINNSNFACNDGIDWHSNIEMDQNLITQGDMPRFILDSYEECRGPPRLFTLDKFDVAGAGACLKRYSDPSFFKMELPSSRILEIELPREKKACKIKKGSRWKNGQTLESLLAPDADSDLQPISSDQVSEKTLGHVRLKSRHLNGMRRSNEGHLMEHLLEIYSSEQNILFGNSISHFHVKVNPVDSTEPATEIHEIVVDALADRTLVGDQNPTESPIKKEVAGLSSYELETQKIKNKELSEALHESFGEIRMNDSDYPVVEQKEMSAKSGYKSEGSVDGDVSGEPEKSSPAPQVVCQNKLLGDAEGISECGVDGYRSDDISSELDNFVDALNTIESDIETDFESRAKADPCVFNMESHGKDSARSEVQQVSQVQFSEPDSVDNSTKSLSSHNMFTIEITSIPDSDSSNLTAAQPTQKNMVSFDLPANSEVCPDKTFEKATETVFEDPAKSDQGVFNMESHGKDSDGNTAQQELQAHFPAPNSVGNSTKSLSLNNMFKSETACVSASVIRTSSTVVQLIQRNMVSVDLLANSEICPGKTHDRTTGELWQNSSTKSLSSDNMFKNEITCISESESSSSTVAQPTQRSMVCFDLPAYSEICPGKTFEKNTETDFEDAAKSDEGVFHMESHGKDSDSNEAQWEMQAHFPAPNSVDNSTKSLSLNNMFKSETACVSDSDIRTSSTVVQPIQRNMVSVDLPANSEICLGKTHDQTTGELWQNSSTKSLSSDNMFKNEITCISDSESSSSTVAQPTQRNMVCFDLPANSEICPGKTFEKNTETDFEDAAKSDKGVFHMESHGKDSDSNEAQWGLQAHFPAPNSVDNSTKSLSLNNKFKSETACVSDSDIRISSIVAQPIQRNMVSVDLPANSEICLGKTHDQTTEEIWQNNKAMELNSLDNFVSNSCVINSTSILVSIHPQWKTHQSQSITREENALPSGLPLESDHPEMFHPEEHVEEDMAETFDMPDYLSQIECRIMSREAPSGCIEDLLILLPASVVGESQESVEPDTRACSGVGKSPIISAFSPAINSVTSHLDGLATNLENGVQPEDACAERSSGFVENGHDIAEEFDGSFLETKDEDVPENRRPSHYPVELNSEGKAITLDVTNHHSQAQDERILGKVPTGFREDLTLPSNGCIGELHESMKQYTGAYSGGNKSATIPSLFPDVSFTVQLEDFAAGMEKVDAPSEHLACLSSSLENAEEMGKVNILMLDALSPELEYFSVAEEPQEFPHVISGGFTHLGSVEDTCPTDVRLQGSVPNHELIECPIPVDNNLKLLDARTEHLSEENALQIGGPAQRDDLVAENAIFNDNSGNAYPSSTYTPETIGLLVQPQENGIPNDAFLYQQLVENQETIRAKDATALDAQSAQLLTLPSSEEDQLVSAPSASNPELSIVDSSDPFASGLLSGVCQTKLSEGVQKDLHSDNNEVNSVYSSESKQDLSLSALPHGVCESAEKKPPTIRFFSEPTIPPEEAASKSQVGSELNVFLVHQEGEHLYPGIPTSSIDLNDELLEPGPEQRSHHSSSDGDGSELDIPPLNKAMCGQVEPETYVSSACSSAGILSSLASNVSAVALPPFASFDIAILETSSQLPFEPQFDEPASSFPLQGVEELAPLPPLPPLEWRRGKLQLCPLSSSRNLCQPLSGTNLLMAPSATDWKHGHGLLEDEGEMVKLATQFVAMSVLEAKSSRHDLFKSDGEKMHPFRLSELPPIAGDESYQHDASFLEGKIVHPSNPSLIVPVVENEKHLSIHNEVREAMLQLSNPFASLSILEDEISQHPTVLQGEILQPSEDANPQRDWLLTSSELERSQESEYGHLSLHRETVQPSNPFLAGSDIEEEKHQHGYGICGGENMQLLQSSVQIPTTALEFPKLGCVTSREENQCCQFDVLPPLDDENLNVKPHSIRSRPRDPLIEAVAAHDRSTMRKVSEIVLPSNKSKGDERDSLLEQIRNKSFNLKPAVVAKSNIKGPPTNLKVAAIVEKANAIRQAFVGSDEDGDKDGWSDS